MTSRITLDDGKYVVLHNNGSDFRALRHGEPWRDLTGDGLVLAMAQRIQELEQAQTAVGETWVRSKLEEIDPLCLEFAEQARAKWACPENYGFATELAYQYGATVLDDDAELLAITNDNMVNIMAVLGFDHRAKGGRRCIVCANAPEPTPDDAVAKALALCVQSLDQLLPYLGHVPADVGLLNDALMAARPALSELRIKGVIL